jgi:hypothetical protein
LKDMKDVKLLALCGGIRLTWGPPLAWRAGLGQHFNINFLLPPPCVTTDMSFNS